MASKSTFPCKLRRLSPKLLGSAVSLALLSVSGNAIAQQGQDTSVEEIVVTGSFIRRTEGFNNASPTTQLSAEDLEAQGTINMAQVVQNLTFNSGTGVTNSIQGVTDRSASFNLRGLGSRATLPLIDGKRLPTSNVQLLLPTMALQRMDIVTDGAAALYGTDAVAGVVNMVPYTSYDGIKFDYYEEGDSRGDYRKNELSFLAGRTFGDVSIVAAGSHRNGGRLKWLDRPDLAFAGLTLGNGAINPGTYRVPERDANGNLTGQTATQPDPSCGLNQDGNQATAGTSPFNIRALGTCWLSYGDAFDLANDIESTSLYGNLSWETSTDLTLSAQIMYSRQMVETRGVTGNPGGRVGDLPTVRGELPGNTFRAVNASGQELFAQPLRDSGGNIVVDGFGRPLPLRGNDGNVVLASNQFSSINADPLGGVPFQEDVHMATWTPFGKIEANTQPSAYAKYGGVSNPGEGDERFFRLAFTADFTVPFVEGWEGTAFYTYGRFADKDRGNQNFSISAITQGLNCDVINDVGSCFNPFGAVDPMFRNPQHVADSIYTQFRSDHRIELQTFDLILNGELPLGGFELPGGPIAAALGYQRREERNVSVPGADDIRNDQFIGSQQLPRTSGRYNNSFFGEFSFPLLNTVELTAAVRNEDFSTGQSETIGKLGITYQALDALVLRATVGEAFIVPTLDQLDQPENCGLSNVNDPFTTTSVFIQSCSTGNPNLLSETSESISVGFDLTLFDDLLWSVSWSETDFIDRIVSTSTQDIARADFRNFQLATGFVSTAAQPNPTTAQLAAWASDPRSESRIFRDDSFKPIRIDQSDSNASKMLVQAWDTQLSYDFSLSDIGLNNWGDINLKLQATYLDTYEFQLSPDDPVREAIGNQNGNFGAVPAMPKIRANFQANWTMGSHSVNATTRYVDEVVFDGNQFAFQARFEGSTWQPTDVIRSWTQLDMFYSYRGLQLGGGELNFTVGSRNLTDREAQKTGAISGVVAELQDPTGRVFYGRINYEF